MGDSLILAMSVEMVWGIAQAALALGFVIFVHELGHFAVAKMCGVQCDKFMVGFDVGGYKVSRKWGETEYGIGILPLGGYVKMLGQVDDPSQLAEQMKESLAAGEEIDETKTKEIVGPNGQKFRVDRRSYLAKTVPQRMAIISAGVIMNVIFAFIFALIAFGIGVDYMPCVVGEVRPGSPAWNAGLQTGDEFIQVGDRKSPAFDHLTQDVMLGDPSQGLACIVRKAATGEEVPMTLKPAKVDDGVRIGIVFGHTAQLNENVPAIEGSPAGNAGFEGGDRIVSINGEPVEGQRDIYRMLAQDPSAELEFRVQRGADGSESASPGAADSGEVTLTVAPNQVERIGLVFKMGPITAIQPGSPAESAGLRVGDQITTINDQAVGIDAGGDIGWDPSTLPYELPTADGDLTVTVIRAGETLAPITVAPRKVDWIERPESPGAPMPLPNLGLAYEISTEVQAVIPNSPADREKLQRGDRIVSALIEAPKDSELKASEKPIPFDDKASNWPYFFVQGLQNLPPGTTIELEVKRGNVDLTASVEAESVPGVYNPDRGLVLQPLLRKRPVASVGEAAALAWDRTVYSLSSVYRFLGKLGTQVSVTKLGGPGTIAVVAYAAATSGIAQLLLFLTMLSANLAVLNFLPIPVLDGGHMVFLVWEGVTGRPAGEKIVVALHAAGFVFLVGLMIFVFGLDISRFLSG